MSANTTIPTPYIRVGDACMDSAVLTARDGFDVAWLRRITPSDNIPGHRFLTDDEWQRMINLIDAAPELLKALDEVCQYVIDEFASSHALCERVADARAVIAKAKGGAL